MGAFDRFALDCTFGGSRAVVWPLDISLDHSGDAGTQGAFSSNLVGAMVIGAPTALDSARSSLLRAPIDALMVLPYAVHRVSGEASLGILEGELAQHGDRRSRR
jgi:hypothetical protein